MRRVAALLLVCHGVAAAERVRVAVAPIAALTEGEGGARVAALESALVDAVAALPGRDVVPPAAVRQALRRAHRRDLESCEGEPGCLAEIGRAVGAGVVVGGEAGALAGGQVVYLKAVATANAAEVGTTTLVVDERTPPATAAAAARAAVYRLLAPRDYLGTLTLRADVAGATVYLDGQKVGTVPMAPLGVAVGTHALRVTHPSHRDFVRFVDVRFGERTDLDVQLADLGAVSDSMHAEAAAAPRPWYLRPWVLVGAGAAIAVAAAVVVFVAFPPSPGRDRDVTVTAPR